MAKSFRELKVWKKAVDLALLVYEFTAEFPKQEMYGLSSQMQRAAVSIASNIAEGSARGTRRDFRQFVKLAGGSNCELQTQLLIARRLRYAEAQKCDELDNLSHEIGKMLTALSKYLTQEIRASALSHSVRSAPTNN
jgi:four helix bundle protein